MIFSQASAPTGQFLSDDALLAVLQQGLDGRFRDQKVLVLIPDHTRSLPLPFLFRSIIAIL
jgi:hypothetical protein